jgi:glycosyltransferase involved in cell wall biosynthesis
MDKKDRVIVSIITVVLNGGKVLEETIRSVISQTYTGIEFIVIDGGSGDDTIEIIKKYEKHITYWVSEKDNGIYDAMNKGIRLAQGDILYFLNCGDSIYDIDVVKDIVLEFHKDSSAGLIYGKAEMYSDDPKVRHISGKIINRSRLWMGMPICHQAAFFKKELFDILGEYNSVFHIAADYEFIVRFMKKSDEIGYKDVFINRLIVKFRIFEGVTSMGNARAIEEIEDISVRYFQLGLLEKMYFHAISLKSFLVSLLSTSIPMKYYRKIKYALIPKTIR